jgi:CRP-like cAMP-binding protein
MLSDLHYQHLLDRMLYFQAISPGFVRLMKPLLGVVNKQKGEILLSAGQKPLRVWYILKGFVREASYDSGIQRTSWFWGEGDFVYAYPGFFSQGIAVNDIIVLDDSVLIEISYEKFMSLKDGFGEVPLLVEKIRDYYDSLRLAHASDQVNLKAGERFRKFIAGNKALFGVAKRRDIASFLGIKEDSLRRFG